MTMSESERQAQLMESKLQEQVIRFFWFSAISLPVWLTGYFGFSITWIIMAILAYVITSFIKKSREARTNAARKLAQDEQAFLANLDNLPSWVFFPDVERAEWINIAIKQAWPFVRGYAVDLLNNSIIPNVRKNLPPTFRTFEFSSLDLGDCAPRIAGIKSYKGENVRRYEIVMDVDLMYFGDCNIELNWKGFKAGITNIEFRGKLRVVIAPLISRMPIAGCMRATFLNNPYINFDLTNIGNVLDLPGLRQLLLRAISDQVASLLVLPKQIVIPMASDLDISQFRFPLPQGVLHLQIVEAKDLEKADFGLLRKGKSDPYIVAKVGQQKFRTKTIDNTVSPVWNETFEALVCVKSGQVLEIEVFDEDPGSKDDPLGSATIDLESVADSGTIDTWLTLDNVKSGTVHVRLSWMNLVSNPSSFGSSPSLLSSAFLFVEVDSCRGLPSLKNGLEPSPIIALSVGGGEEQFSSRVQASPNPVFEEGFNFLVGNPTVYQLHLVVFNDKKDGETLGTLNLRLQTLYGEKDMQLNRRFKLDTGRDNNTEVTLRLVLRALVDGPASQFSAHDDVSFVKNQSKPSKTADFSEPASSSTPYGDDAQSNSDVQSSTDGTNLAESSSSPTASSSDVRYRGSKAAQGQLQVTLRFSTSAQSLAVVVLKAADLKGIESNEDADLYVKAFVVNGDQQSKKAKTKTVKGSLSPVFDERFEFPIKEVELQNCILYLELKHRSGTFTSKSIGKASIPLDNFQQNSANWYGISSANSD